MKLGEEMENWRVVEGFEAYEVSDLGRIRSKTLHKSSKNKSGHKGVYWHKASQSWTAQATINGEQEHLGCFTNINAAIRAVEKITPVNVGIILKPHINKQNGYLYVRLQRDFKKHTKTVHRLVAEAFIPNPLGLPEVNHLGTHHDCRAEKLEWTTKLGNTLHAVKTGRTPGDGISFDKKSGKFLVRYFSRPNVREDVGRFLTFEEAKAVRNFKISTLETTYGKQF